MTDKGSRTFLERGRRRGRTTRGRILVWLLGLVTVALVANLLISAQVLVGRADARLNGELEHENEKLRTFARQATGDFSSGAELLAAYLATVNPEDHETLFSVVDGEPDRRSSNEPPARLDRDPQFVAEVARATGPVVGNWASSAGQARYGVFPIAVDGDVTTARLVVVEFAEASHEETITTVRALATVSLIALVAAGVASWLVAGRLLRPIRDVSDTAETISQSDLSRRIAVTGDDDVADLSRIFNRMLDRLEAAFDAQRQFLDDVSHELRTPITVVRGHLEVMSDDPEDHREAVPLLIDELSRMGRMVDDLLVIARADRPDFLNIGPVDLADLTIEAVAKARTLGDRRWEVTEVAEATIVGDGQRLTQAYMQLISNAVGHTSPGARIAVGSAIRGGRVLLWVQDEGSGIANGDQEHIFDRFDTGSDASGSTGLGLSIVRSIAEAHHGEVRVQSEPGQGSTFTLDLAVPFADSTHPLRTTP